MYVTLCGCCLAIVTKQVTLNKHDLPVFPNELASHCTAVRPTCLVFAPVTVTEDAVQKAEGVMRQHVREPYNPQLRCHVHNLQPKL